MTVLGRRIVATVQRGIVRFGESRASEHVPVIKLRQVVYLCWPIQLTLYCLFHSCFAVCSQRTIISHTILVKCVNGVTGMLQVPPDLTLNSLWRDRTVVTLVTAGGWVSEQFNAV